MPPGKLNTTKRFAVRLSLVTGSTLATVIGAQSLASVNKPLTATPDPVLPAAVAPQLQSTGTVAPALEVRDDAQQVAIPAAATAAPVHAAPVITVLRHAGQTSAVVPNAQTQSAAPSNVTIKPPSPVQLAAPAPVIVQAPGETIYVPAASAAPAPSQPTTRSSRR
jgi:hypothetical protein